MAGRKSIAIWPTVNDHAKTRLKAKVPPKQRGQHKIPDRPSTIPQIADLHINIWRLDEKGAFCRRKKPPKRHLDIGFKIEHPNDIDAVNVYIPEVEEPEIEDLFSKLKDIDVLSAVFNEDLSITINKDAYQHQVSGGKLQEFTLHELDITKDIKKIKYEDGIIFSISVPNNITNEAYIRIRIEGTSIEHCTTQEKLAQHFIQSIFSKVEITELRINNLRTLDRRLKDKINAEGVFDFRKIHVLYICSSKDEIMVDSPNAKVCRFLESDIWGKYIDLTDDNSKNNGVLAYHWKFESRRDCSVLIKNKFEYLSFWRVARYFAYALVFAFATNILASYTYENWDFF